MAEIPVTAIAGVWARCVHNVGLHPEFELGVTLADGSELPLGTYDLFATTLAHISGVGIKKALQQRAEAHKEGHMCRSQGRRTHLDPAPH